MPSLLTSLTALCREHPLREKVVVVPSLAIGHQIGDAVARGGTPWVNLRFETTRTIADAVAGFALAREGWTVLSRAQALAIVERACDRVLGDDSYFAVLRGRPGLYRAIQRSIDDLRHAGARQLPADAFEDPRKARDLERVLEAYEEELASRKFADRYAVVARAISILESDAPRPWPADAVWVVSGELEPSSAESRLVGLVGGGFAPHSESGGFAPHPAFGHPLPASGERGGVFAVSFVRAVGEENELRHALRRAVPVDDVEIVYTTREPYLALAWELTSEAGIPATFAEGISAAYTRPGQAVLGFLRWVSDDFDASHLAAIARSGALRIEGKELTPFAFGRVLRKAMIGWGRDRYLPRLAAAVSRLEARLAETDSESRRAGIEREIARIRASQPVVEALLAMTEPVAGAEAIDAGALAQAGLRFLERFASTRNEIDGMALAALRRTFLELTRLPEATAPRAIAIDRLRDAVAAVHVAASNPRPGHLHVAPVRAGGWSGRTSLFVVGLDDAKHPGSGLQDPVVLDAERNRINESITPRRLDLPGDAPSRASARLHALFARVPHARWTLSWSEMDLAERRERFPSRDVLDLHRAAKPHGSYETLVAAAERAGFIEERAPLSLAEWGLASRFAHGAPPVPPRGRGEPPPFLRVDDLDPRTTGRVYSASQLESMAKCPFGWFLERVLKIEPLEEIERVADQWLDSRQFGLLVHEVLEETMQELCERGERVSLEAHLPRTHAIAAEALERWRAEVPPGSETAYARQREELHTTCEIFLRAEERLCDRIVPKFFEVEFGGDEPFAIPLGGGKEVKLRGSIDRVDQDVTTGDWEVWDYKTGGLFEYHDEWRLRRGTKLQHVIYTRALEHILGRRGLSGRVQCAGYYFPTPKGSGERNARECAPGELERALNALFDVVGGGFFPQPAEGRCAFCPYEEVCGTNEEIAARMARIAEEHAGATPVRRWLELQEVE